jgi:amino acid permease
MPWKWNVIVSFFLVLFCFILSVTITSIKDAITLVGATVNPLAGFMLPVWFYWKVKEKEPFFSPDKLISLSIAIVIGIVSILSLLDFFLSKFDPNYN